MRHQLRLAAASALLTSVLALHASHISAQVRIDTRGTRLDGVATGDHAVGFDVRHGIDPSRRINRTDAGSRVGLAIWYPAQPGARGTPMTTLDYRLLEFFTPRSEAERRAYEEDEVNAMVAWRHVGIVELTREEARAALRTGGVAVRGASPAAGRHPVVMLLGGRFYLSTTAEILASHGFVVVAPFRFIDQANEVGASEYPWYLENSVRDAEWAMTELSALPNADPTSVSAIGHGGGGMQAMLFAMRNRNVRALVNLDAGNFSERSRPRQLPFYSPRLMRAPYLFVATPATKQGLDLFEDFLAMKFSERYEIILESPNVRHHDLSDLGRGVTAPLGLRGDAQADVQDQYARIHAIIVRFLRAYAGAMPEEGDRFAESLNANALARGFAVTRHAAIDPAPTIVDMLNRLDATTPATLRAGRERDPDAPLFHRASLARLLSAALVSGKYDAAEAIAAFALEVYPSTPIFLDYRSRALEGRGDVAGAAQVAAACAAMQAGTDWQAAAAIDACKARIVRSP